MFEAVKRGLQKIKDRVTEAMLAVGAGVTLAVADVVPSYAQSASIFPVSADVATVKSDLLLWAAALISVALAIFAFKRVRGLVTR